MLEWLTAPLFLDRPHLLSVHQQWHARLMFLAWGVLAPLAVVIARFFKVLPRQDWPRQLDSQFWWRVHWIGQSLVLVFSLLGVGLVYHLNTTALNTHSTLGYMVVVLAIGQVTLGYFRGSKGGPTDPHANGSLQGDHYDMNLRRRLFEIAHKLLGYSVLLLAATTIIAGLWQVNAPRWMWASIVAWWLLLIVMSIRLQRSGYAIDTYQAIWGPDSRHPGNQRAPTGRGWGWGMRRLETDAESASRKNTPD